MKQQQQHIELDNTISRMKSDECFRSELHEDGRLFFEEIGLTIPHGIKVKVVENSPDTTYMVLPPDPNKPLLDEWINIISAGGLAPDNAMAVSNSWLYCVSAIPMEVVTPS